MKGKDYLLVGLLSATIALLVSRAVSIQITAITAKTVMARLTISTILPMVQGMIEGAKTSRTEATPSISNIQWRATASQQNIIN